PVLARDDPLDVFGDQGQQTLSVTAADRGEEVLHGLDVLLGAHRNVSISFGSDRVRHGSLGEEVVSPIELDQVLEDQLTPAVSARLDKQPTLRKPAESDRRETEIFREHSNLRCGAFIVARQEHDSPATLYGRILVEDRGDQMVEALDQSCTSESLCDEF